MKEKGKMPTDQPVCRMNQSCIRLFGCREAELNQSSPGITVTDLL